VPDREEFFEGFIDDYFAEAEEHIAGATRVLLALEASLGDAGAERAAIDELFRTFHTLKGISAMVELRPAERLAHHLEDYLRALRDRRIVLSIDGIDLLIQGTQRLDQIVAARRAATATPAIDDVVARVAAILAGRPDASDPPAGGRSAEALDASTDNGGAALSGGAPRRWVCTFAPTRELLANGIGVDVIRKRLAAIGTIVSAVPQVGPDGTIAFEFTLATRPDVDVIVALSASPLAIAPLNAAADVAIDARVPAAPAPAGAASAGVGGRSHAAVRVDLARLDELMRNVGDLVISRSRLNEMLARVEGYVPPVEWRAVAENTLAIDRQLRTLREGLMRVRLVPIGEIFRRMPFVVRDLARESGKRVTLNLEGQSTKIDKFLIERMMDPVLHLVRNAISHGIESPDDRVAGGKRPEGTITLSASTAGDIVTLEVDDDGRGVDADAVARRARAAGLTMDAGVPDPSALLAILCAPGFSTKDDADLASGRGVGMAVVKETIEQLSGTMALETQPGMGTRFTIQLPLTLAVADALIGRVGSESFAVPQSAVREVIEVADADVRLIEQHEIIPYRGGALPIMRLDRLFGIRSETKPRFHVFVVGVGAGAVGLAVDRIVGQREVVVRSIVDPLVHVEGITGATDLGDGRVVLILDPARLTRPDGLGARRAAGAR
jgi:two-component system, chemotaxis family, sensor kinase CheA